MHPRQGLAMVPTMQLIRVLWRVQASAYARFRTPTTMPEVDSDYLYQPSGTMTHAGDSQIG